ncbi:hypothetical protein Drose_04135 [Dactylosporangium roseum]|uniref:DUF222 domain-containing protein n=1 Tax=Dactylosporangium roseum TaxID=47989 RepID=A0ABY5Z5Y5_9ACTN|nr:hypothetical protein [Dactylosporangium roseum]UWZ37478.1 hypothetical protein Drose_04135 [Dactylosporangium roseum]
MEWDIESIIDEAEPAEATVVITVKGSLRSEYDLLEAQLGGMTQAVTSLAGDSPATGIAERMAALTEQMRAYERPFKLRALTPRRSWRNLMAKRPVKTPGMSDEEYLDAYHPWLCSIVAATVAQPEMTQQQAERLADRLSDGDWKKLANAAWEVNDESREVPFSVAASVLTRSSGARSKRPETSDNPAPGSLAGSPEPSPSTSTTSTTG